MNIIVKKIDKWLPCACTFAAGMNMISAYYSYYNGSSMYAMKHIAVVIVCFILAYLNMKE